jgi:formamidopyrimidine-DNA glycosylase
LEGSKLEDVYRSGKEFRFKFSNGVILGMHLMLTGDIFPFEGKNEQKFTIVELEFEGHKGFALTDRMKNAFVKLNPEDKDGVDAMSPGLNFKYLRSICARKTPIKTIMLDQNLIRGIGNGYSDEILWEAKISPYSHADAIPDDKLKELVKTIKKVLKTSTEKILKAYPGLITGEVKEFHKIHQRERKESPTGAEIKIDKSGARKTYYTDEQVLYK